MTMPISSSTGAPPMTEYSQDFSREEERFTYRLVFTHFTFFSPFNSSLYRLLSKSRFNLIVQNDGAHNSDDIPEFVTFLESCDKPRKTHGVLLAMKHTEPFPKQSFLL